MTTLAAGSSVTLTLDDNDTLTVSGMARATVTPPGGTSFETSLSGTQRLGPFGAAVSVVLRAIAQVTYTRTSAGVSGITRNGSNQVSGFTVGDVSYTFTYPTNQIVCTGSDGSVQTMNLSGGYFTDVN